MMSREKSFEAYAAREVDRLRSAHLLRHPRTVESAQGPVIRVANRDVICLCSNNYLGFANDDRLRAAASAALANDGTGACAARHITGSMRTHLVVEQRVASFVNQPSALLLSTGYATNLGALQALTRTDGEVLVLSDELNHASIIDGCRLGRGRVLVFRHGDAQHARELLRLHRRSHTLALLVTESLFSMDGDFAPLKELRSLCDEYDTALMVDEAHALGVVGPGGRGRCAELGIQPDLLVGTFGKAFGCSGAFVAGSQTIVKLIENRARSYVFSTAPSPAIAAAALAAIDLVEHADSRRARLATHAQTLRLGLKDLGYDVLPGTSQIIPVLLGAAEKAHFFSNRLLELGIFVHGIRPPTVATGTSRLRVSPMATHEDAHIALALEKFSELDC